MTFDLADRHAKLLLLTQSLESSLGVLKGALERGDAGPETEHFYREEVPLALADAEEALASLKRLAHPISQAAPQDQAASG